MIRKTLVAILTAGMLTASGCHAKKTVEPVTSTRLTGTPGSVIHIIPRTSNAELMKNLTIVQQQKIIEANTHIRALTNDFWKVFGDWYYKQVHERSKLANKWFNIVQKKYIDTSSRAYKQQMGICNKYFTIINGNYSDGHNPIEVFANTLGEVSELFPDNSFFTYNPSTKKELLVRVDDFLRKVEDVRKTLDAGAKDDWIKGVDLEFKPLVENIARRMYLEEVPVSTLFSDLVTIRGWIGGLSV